MKFIKYVKFWVDDLGWPDISIGFHICMVGRIDIHFLKWIISIGKVPIYETNKGSQFATSNSYDINYRKPWHKKELIPLRVGAHP
jgi:hypothetical protein